MTDKEFENIRQIEGYDMSDLDVGDRFLFGQNMIKQTYLAEPGKMVSYFEVIAKNPTNGNIEYVTKFERLDKAIGE